MHLTRPISVLAAVAIAMTACTGASPGGTPASSAATASAAALPQSLTVVVAAEPTTLDGLYESAGPVFNTITQNFFETLATLDTSTNQVKPWLATGWKQIDPLNWQITIRGNVKFHDGSTMTADDVVASINYSLQKDSKVQSSYLSAWKSAQKIDATTVQITTPAPDPILPLQLQFASVAPASAVAKGVNYMATNATGTGPYKVVAWSKGESLTLAKFDGYWGTPGTIKDIKYVWRKESSVRADMVRAGEAQMAQSLTVADLKNLPKVANVPGLDVYILTLNANGQTKPSVMQDERVRLAVNYAIDRNAIKDKIYGGQATLTHGNIVTPVVQGYNSQIDEYPFDQAKAKSLIAEAGAAGKTVTFVCTGGRFLNDGELCQFVTAQLNQVGLNVQMTNPTFADWLVLYRNGPAGQNRPDILFGGPGNETLDLAAKSAPVYFRSWKAGGGGATIDDPALDQMTAQAMAEADLTRRRALEEQIAKYVHDHAYIAALIAPNRIWGLAKNIDFKPLSNDNLFLTSVRYTN